MVPLTWRPGWRELHASLWGECLWYKGVSQWCMIVADSNSMYEHSDSRRTCAQGENLHLGMHPKSWPKLYSRLATHTATHAWPVIRALAYANGAWSTTVAFNEMNHCIKTVVNTTIASLHAGMVGWWSVRTLLRRLTGTSTTYSN